ncbi:MAG: hypothetical protein GXY36_01490 [Chloroflexi bacterium]|nr:hypothetical protein [Chloroflexota bacterium]
MSNGTGDPQPVKGRTRLDWLQQGLLIIILGLIILFMLLTLYVAFVRADRYRTGDDSPQPVVLEITSLAENGDPIEAPVDPSQSVQEALRLSQEARAEALRAAESAQNTSDNLDLILSYLEGAAVLVGLAAGAAALFGMRNWNETRDKLETEIEKLNSQRQDLEGYKADLKNLPDSLRRAEALMRQISDADAIMQKLPEDFRRIQGMQQGLNHLLFAQDQLRLNNYPEAYAAVLAALAAADGQNDYALYIAGWLELQYISKPEQDGLERLASVKDRSPFLRAAYGVGLRRKAKDVEDQAEQRRMYNRAEAELIYALSESPQLLDLNFESYWGPVGGIRREKKAIDEAITAYQNALEVTPRSSYPMGNLAALYLMKAKAEPESGQRDDWVDRAAVTFADTLIFATAELAIMPTDYYHVMDIAQSMMMLGQRDATNFQEAHKRLDSAIHMKQATFKTLGVSLRGWRDLYDNCPDEWPEVRENLAEAIKRVEAAIEERKATESPPSA